MQVEAPTIKKGNDCWMTWKLMDKVDFICDPEVAVSLAFKKADNDSGGA